MERDVLSIEIDRELNRAHKFVNALMADKKAQKRFFRNPSQVMIDLGLLPAEDEVLHRCRKQNFLPDAE